MKKFVRVEIGSRGEIESVELVEGSVESLKKEFDEYVEYFREGCEDEEEFKSYEEFMNFESFKEGYISEGRNEEWCFLYIEYEKFKELCDELLEIDKKIINREIEYYEYVNRVNEIMDIVMGYC